jgi:surfeit locus 1 family protein
LAVEQVAAPGPARRRPLFQSVLGTLALLLVVIACVRLGFWQLDRLAQRRALNERIATRLAAPPLADPAALNDTAAALYHRVAIAGRFDDARSIALPGRALRGVPGVHLLTPLLVAPETAVLVNRGWLPSPDAATIEWDSIPAGTAAGGTTALTGLVLPFPAERVAQRESPVGFRRVWYRMDRAAVQGQYPYRLLPAVVQLLPEPGAAARPERLEPPVLDDGPHLSYALQWFAFAAIGVFGWLALVLRARGGRGHKAPAVPNDKSRSWSPSR